MCDGYVYVLNAFYWCGDGKTMVSPILEVTTIQYGGAFAKKVYTALQVSSRLNLEPRAEVRMFVALCRNHSK
ncbi:MAG: hypothetical protein O7D30_08635 [Rickettsia endosymbiont of Ixodes persulcatus]|nr:hypothetical protein [Rickettsia endosymbiont of Ixodes persulcatus]